MARKAKRSVGGEITFIDVENSVWEGSVKLTGRGPNSPVDVVLKMPVSSIYSLINGLRRALEEQRKHIVDLQQQMQKPVSG